MHRSISQQVVANIEIAEGVTFWLAILRYGLRDLVGFVVWGSWLRSGEQFQPRAVGVRVEFEWY